MEFRICELQLVPQLVQLVDISCKKKNMRQAGQRHMFLPTYPENCPLFWKNPSPSEENIHFGGEIKSEIVPFFLYGLVTYMTGIFLKKIGQFRTLFPLQNGCFLQMGRGFSRYVGNFPDMWAETHVSALLVSDSFFARNIH